MFPVSYESLAIAALAVACAYFVFGITGFGAATITVPVISHMWPLQFVLPVCVLLDLAASLVLGVGFRREAVRGEIVRMIPLSLVGAICGLSLLVSLPRNAAMAALGAAALAYGAWSLHQPVAMRRTARGWAYPAGFAGGLTGTLFGIGGPPYMVYLSRRIEDKGALRATMATMVVFSVGMRTVLFLIAGLLMWDEAKTFLALLPFAGLGMWLGSHAHSRVSRQQLGRLVGLLVMASGASLLWRALA